MADSYFPRPQNFVQIKAELSVVTPSGKNTGMDFSNILHFMF